MARLSPLYPRAPVNVSRWLRPLPADGSIPEMPGWQWLHTPGHTPGHISLWREADRTIVAGDAFITTRQESAYAVAAQSPEMRGPPQFTRDGRIPERPGWRWRHAPGLTPGHISLWRVAPRPSAPGDAFITARQKSASAVAARSPELQGPPQYFTVDWRAARASV